MNPYAELLNHENVDVQYDYIDKEGKTLDCRKEEKLKEEKEERLMQMLRKKLFLDELKTDLIKMEVELKEKLENEGKEVPEYLDQKIDEQTEEQRSSAIDFKLSVDLGGETKTTLEDEKKGEQKEDKPEEKEENYDYSSGIESDNDVDLLVE